MMRWTLADYEPEVINAIERFGRPGDCMVDAGASVGHHTSVMSRSVGENGLVFAIEPHWESFQLLEYRMRTEKLANVKGLRLGLWTGDANLKLWSVKDLGYSSFYPYALDADKTECVDCRALDDVLGEHHPRLIKIDCEGTEPEILAGAYNTLSRGVDCVILELNYHIMKNLNRVDSNVRGYMDALGYDMFLINISDGNGDFLAPIKVKPEQQIGLINGYHINVIFSTEEKVKERWQ